MTTLDELKRAVWRLSDPDLVYDREGDLMGHLVDLDDLRLLLSERAELLAAVERMRDGLKKIELLPLRLLWLDPMDDFTKGAQAARLNAADIARAALTTGEEK